MLRKKHLPAALLLALCLILLLACGAYAQSISVLPSSQNVSVHSNSAASVNISLNVTNLYGYQYDVQYNQSIFSINQSNIQEGPFLKTGISSTLCITPNVSTQGLIRYVACSRTGSTNVSGTGNITKITFTISQNATAPSTTQIRLAGTKLSNIYGLPISHSVSNATINLFPCLSGEWRAWGNDVGECVSGNQSCLGNNTWGSCSGCVGPVNETCDSKDNDCDSYIDENLTGCQTNITVRTSYYDGSTTNFSALNLSNAVQGMILEKMIYGKMVFREDVIFTQSVDLDYNTNISLNNAYINSTVFPMLNKSAIIYLYNLTFVNPQIQRDGASCPSSVCTFVNYSGGTLTFNVTYFSTYYAAEGPYCGDGSCSGTEDCSSCPGDCGECNGGDGGGGNGGGGGGAACTGNETRSCSVSHQGACAAGTETCVNGNWTGCPSPSSEICNHEDDDCDNQTDESLACECYAGDTRACGSNVGECNEGIRYCSNTGSWGDVCTGEVKGSAEVCNGLDDDCNGELDDNCVQPSEIPACAEGIIPDTGCICGDKAYTTGYCYGGVYSDESREFPWITLTIIGVIIILVLTIIIIYKEFYRKGRGQVSWDELLEKYKTSLLPVRRRTYL